MSSAASGRKDFILEYGNDINTEGYIENKTTIESEEKVNQITHLVRDGLSNINFTGSNQITLTHDFTLDINAIGHNKSNSLHRLIHERTKSNVISLYVNIRILTGDDNLYYGAATAVGGILETLESIQRKTS